MTEHFLRFPKTQTDEQLQADRDAKHEREVQEWFAEHPELTPMSNLCESCAHPATDHTDGTCSAEVNDYYGTWKCVCPRFEREPDEGVR